MVTQVIECDLLLLSIDARNSQVGIDTCLECELPSCIFDVTHTYPEACKPNSKRGEASLKPAKRLKHAYRRKEGLVHRGSGHDNR